MIGFLLFYKLCERGEAVFPIYLGTFTLKQFQQRKLIEFITKEDR